MLLSLDCHDDLLGLNGRQMRRKPGPVHALFVESPRLSSIAPTIPALRPNPGSALVNPQPYA
jgi:hypothetical protein